MKTETARRGGGGRRPGEKGGMPVAKDRTRVQHRRLCPDLDEKDRRDSHGDGRHSVHSDAQRAMVCLGLQGMDVRDLENRNQRQQDEAHHHRCREGPPGAEVSIAF